MPYSLGLLQSEGLPGTWDLLFSPGESQANRDKLVTLTHITSAHGGMSEEGAWWRRNASGSGNQSAAQGERGHEEMHGDYGGLQRPSCLEPLAGVNSKRFQVWCGLKCRLWDCTRPGYFHSMTSWLEGVYGLAADGKGSGVLCVAGTLTLVLASCACLHKLL